MNTVNTAQPDNAFVSDKRSVSTDRFIDHYYQLLTVTADARDVQQFCVRALRRVYSVDSRVAALTGPLPDLRADDASFAPLADTGLSESVRHAIEEMTQNLLARQAAVRESVASQERLHQGSLLKMLHEATSALTNGMRATGRDRQEDFKDAVRLFRTIQEDPVSGRDYTVWFHVAWLLWKLDGNLPDAEEAFYQASRLSASSGDVYHPLSLRHLAYMQYLQGNFAAAYATLAKALPSNADDGDLLYDAARYAARVGKGGDAVTAVERCYERNPLLLLFAFTEPDFAETGLDTAIAEMLKGKREQAVTQVRQEATRWEAAAALAAEAASRAEIALELPHTLQAAAEGKLLLKDLAAADYFTVRDVARQVVGKGKAIREMVEDRLSAQISTIEAEAERIQKQLEKLQQDRDTWRGTVKWLEKEAKQAGYSLKHSGPLEGLKLRLQKRHDRVMTARHNYTQSKDNLSAANASLKAQAPGLQKQIAEFNERRERIVAARDWFLAEAGGADGG